MAQTVLGVFNNRDQAEKTIGELQKLGYNTKDLSIIMKDTAEAKEMAKDTGSKIAGGATTGGIIGAVAGLLIGVGAIAVPGIGALLIGGPIAAALGLTGIAATTASGAVTGALAGGLVGGLVSLGVSEDEARDYESKVKSGGILLMVPVNSDTQETQVRDLMEQNQATQIDTFNSNF